jgi:photosystem II stability/assembly factor-like uncharacterized protein
MSSKYFIKMICETGLALLLLSNIPLLSQSIEFKHYKPVPGNGYTSLVQDNFGNIVFAGEYLKFSKFTPETDSWLCFNLPEFGTMTDISFTKNGICYAIVDSLKILKSQDHGISWTQIKTSTQKLAGINAVDDVFFYVINYGKGILQSPNGGMDLITKFSHPVDDRLTKIGFIDRNSGLASGDFVYIARNQTLQKIFHQGVPVTGFNVLKPTQILLNTSTKLVMIESLDDSGSVLKSFEAEISRVDVSDTNRWFVRLVDGRIYRTLDSGLSWDLITTNMPVNLTAIKMYTNTNGYLISERKIYETSNSGVIWNTTEYESVFPYDLATVGFGDSLYFKRFGTLYFSPDMGNTINSITTPAAPAAFSVTDNRMLVVATDYHIYISSDNGTTWIDRSINHPFGFHNSKMEARGNNIYVVGLDARFGFSSDLGVTWQLFYLPSDRTPLSISIQNENIFTLTLADYNICYTTDRGNNWFLTRCDFDGQPKKAHFYNENECIVSTGYSLVKSSDRGITWTKILTLPAFEVGTLYMEDGRIMVTANYNGKNWLNYSSNKGVTWMILNPGHDRRINLIVSDKNKQINLFSYDGRSVRLVDYRTLPVEFTNFSCKSEPDGRVLIEWSTASETNNFGFEVQRTTGDDWCIVAFVKGQGTTVSNTAYSFIDNPVDLGSKKVKYRLKQIDFDGTFAFSNEIDADILLDGFHLSQNYPNPFNPTTSIDYTIVEPAEIHLDVYDMAGQLVKSLFSGMRQPGHYSIELEMQRFASGNYFVRLDTGNYRKTIKITLLK